MKRNYLVHYVDYTGRVHGSTILEGPVDNITAETLHDWSIELYNELNDECVDVISFSPMNIIEE